MFGSIELSGNDWFVPVVVLLALALMILTWGYRSAILTKKIRSVSYALKTVGLLLLALCLLEPVWVESRARPGSNLFLIVADNGEGLNIRDRKSAETRGEILKKILTGPGSEWQKDLEDDFQVRKYLFDTRLRLTKNFSDLEYTGKLSEMSGALHRIQERYDGQPLAGILLLTDGIATDWDSSSLDLENLPPVYPVPIGVGFPAKDISVSNVSVTQTAFEDAPVTINADVEVVGFSGRSVDAELLDSEDMVVENQTLSVTEDQQKLAFRFRIHPEKPGVSFYRFTVKVAADSGEPDAESGAYDKEATLANNQSHIVVERPVDPFRMLYVAGRPNWDYKFLNRAVQGDSQLTMAALIRIAKKAPRFQYLGRVGEQSNPLYRGFGENDDEEKEDHDQAVMKRLNVKDSIELRDGFPKSREVLYEYDAVILDDLEAAFFSANQMDLIRRFVSERGGGFLMMGGQESFRQGKYANTPIEDLLPVYLYPPDSLTPADDLGLQLTREGWVQPWARLRANETDEEERFKQMPPFKVMNKVKRIKPGASVIAEAVDPYLQVYPALITQRYGRGKSAALTIGDMYRWGLGKKEQTEDRSKAWRQLLRWLVVEARQRVEIELEPDTDLNGFARKIEVRVRNKAFEPMDEATIQLEVLREGEEEAILLPAEPSNKEPGLFVASFVPRETAGYSVRVKALDNQNELIGEDEAGWSNDFAAEEFKSLNPNLPLLENLAEKTQGEVVRAKDISQFIRTLSKKDAPITEQFRTPLWHSPIIFLLALVCFISEWGLRRWNRMP